MSDSHARLRQQGILLKRGARARSRGQRAVRGRGRGRASVLPMDDPIHNLLMDKNMGKLRYGGKEIKCNTRRLGLSSAEAIGKGEFGQVFKVHIPELGIPVAVKRVPDATREQHRRRSLLADLKTSRLITHENFVRFLGFDYWDASLHIFLELMDADWDRIYTTTARVGERIPEGVLRVVTSSIGSALAHLQHRRILHRDIKPSNLLLGFDGTVKLCDFGISRELPEDKSEGASTFVGCGPYMSPERLAEKSYGLSSEIWSTAMTLLELANLQHPFGDQMHNLVHIMEAIPKRTFDSSVPSMYSAELSNLIDRCLIRECEKRISVDKFNEHPFLRGPREDAAAWWQAIKEQAESDTTDGDGVERETSGSAPTNDDDDDDNDDDDDERGRASRDEAVGVRAMSISVDSSDGSAPCTSAQQQQQQQQGRAKKSSRSSGDDDLATPVASEVYSSDITPTPSNVPPG